MVRYRETLATTAYAYGHGLDGTGRVTLYVKGFGQYRHGNLDEAFGWKLAAESCGFEVQVYA